jgi:hypothetical protein
MRAPHDANYFRERRRKQGVRVREDAYLHSAIAVARGRELREMMELPLLDWRSDFFTNSVHANSYKRRR